MDAYRSEEEQLAEIKNWWKNNGNSLLMGIGLALIVVFGWKAYQKHTRETAEAASNKYQALIQDLTNTGTDKKDALANAKVFIHDLKQDFPNTQYAQYASLVLSKIELQEGNTKAAEDELRSVLQQKPTPEVQRLVTSRLARVLAVEGRIDDALALLNVDTKDVFYAYFQEVKGDILVQAGKRDEARQAYQAALDNSKGEGQSSSILQIKLDDLATQAK